MARLILTNSVWDRSGTIDSYYGPTKNLWNSDVLTKYYSCDTYRNECVKESCSEDSWHIAGITEPCDVLRFL